MDITVGINPLSEAVQVCGRLVASRMSRLGGGILLSTVSSGELEITGTDLTSVYSTTIEGTVTKEGKQVVSAKWLQDVVKVLGGDEVNIKERPGESAVEIVSGKSRFMLRTIPVENFPEVTTDVGSGALSFSISKEDFDKAVSQVVVAAGVDEARPVFTGCLFYVGSSAVKLVATDSYRLAERVIEAEARGEKKAVIGARVLEEITRWKDGEGEGEITIELGVDSGAFVVGRNKLKSRYIEGTFPDYERLIPTDNPHRCIVPREELMDAVRRVSVLAKDVTPVRVVLSEDATRVEVKDSEIGEATEEIEGAIYSGENLEVAFNPKYLLDAVGGCEGEKVSLEIKDPLSAVLIRSEERENYRHLVMPIRL